MVQESSYDLRSPSSSPSLAAVDSSPPSSPGLSAITPPASPGARDPFAGSTKSSKRPRIYERHGSQKSIGSGSVDLTDVTPTRLTRVVDPLSGSAKSNWVPPTYERRTPRVTSEEDATGATSSRSYVYATRSIRGYTSPTPRRELIPSELDEPDDFSLTDDDADQSKAPAAPKTREELEEKLWDEGIANAIDKLNGTIDLSGSGLGRGAITHIPPSIADLEGFIVLPQTHSPSSAPPSPTLSPVATSRPFTRATTLAAPQFDASFFRSRDGERLRGTPAARAASLQAVVQQPTAQRRIQIYLANNSIARLPPELFRVNALTVLSLRSNKLTFVPPQITQLKALQELNLAQNRLRWLPAEMLGMRLTKLAVSGNPWLSPPSPPSPTPPPSQQPTDPAPSAGREDGHRPVSNTTVHFTIPPLAEICLRILLAPSRPPSQPSSLTHSSPSPASMSRRQHAESDSSPCYGPPTKPKPRTVLEARYALPLSEDDHYSPALLRTLRACVPAAVARPPEFDRDRDRERHRRAAKVRRAEAWGDVHSGREQGTRGDDEDGDAGDDKDGNDDGDEDGDVFAAPRAVAEEEEVVAGASACPSPLHRTGGPGLGQGQGQEQGPVYVRHAEERWTWEEVVAGVHVGAEGSGGGGGVPVRWRGCSRGCLAFLDPLLPPLPPAPVQENGEREGQGQQQGQERREVDVGEAQDADAEEELDLDFGVGGSGGVGGDFGAADVDMDMEDV